MDPPMPDELKRILLATQATEFDVGAERVAIDLAARWDVPLLGVVPLVSNSEAEMLAPRLEERIEADLAASLESLRQSAAAKGVALLTQVRIGEEPYREIVDEATERAVDLMVLRRRGQRSYLANILFGEMVHTVTSHAPCDVLIVPRAAQLWSRHILLATDGSPNSDRATKIAAIVALRDGLPMTVMSADESRDGSYTATQANVDRSLAVVRNLGAAASGRVETGRAPEAILSAVGTIGADLIVVGRRGLGRVRRATVGSTSERVAGLASCPVMIVRA
jgi:nucleotide-binding universal stress UspA family protein